MKLTANRKLILKLIDEEIADCGGRPPYRAIDLHYAIHFLGFDEWYAEQDGTEKPTTKASIQQIHRTLNDLEKAGLIIHEYRIDDHYQKGLPQRVAYWQLAEKAEYNRIVNTCNALYRKTHRAKFWITFFGATIDKGLQHDQVDQLKANITAMMQKTHPDKVDGFIEQFKQLQECLQWIKDGIDAPNNIDDKPKAINQTVC
jgi:hypothetical protein